MPSKRVIYSRGFPYGAPLVMLRGGGLKIPGVRGYIVERGFHWSPERHAYQTYLDREDFTQVLKVLRDAYGCEVMPKDSMDDNYIIDLAQASESVSTVIERAREAQQTHEQKHDVQLEIPNEKEGRK